MPPQDSGQRSAKPGAFAWGVTAADPEPQYTVYRNSRYGFSIEVPSHFVRQTPPTNNDGQSFTSPGGDAVLIVYGSNNIDDSTALDQYKGMVAEKKGKLGYHVCGDDWFVVTWAEGDDVLFYQKSHVGPGSSNSFILSYPRQKSAYYEPIIKRAEGTFRRGDTGRAH